MAKYTTARGQTGNIAFVFLPDSASTTGGGKTALTNASAALNITVRREKSSTVTTYTGTNIGTITTLGTWVDPGAGKCNFKEIDATNLPGLYEVHLVDLLAGTSDTSRKLLGMVTATGIAPTPFEVALTGIDVQDGVRGGMSALPSNPPGGSGGLLTAGMGAGQINPTGGNVPSDLQTIKGQVVTATGAFSFDAQATAQTNTASIKTTIGTAGAGLTSIPYTGPSVGTIQSGLATSASQTTIITNIAALPTAAQNAHAVWQDTTGSDFATNGSSPTPGSIIVQLGGIFTTVSSSVLTSGALANLPAVTLTAGTITSIQSGLMLASSYTAPDNADIVSALADLVALLARTDPTSALGAVKAVTDRVSSMLAVSGGNWTYTVDALKNAPAGGGGGGTTTINIQDAAT